MSITSLSRDLSNDPCMVRMTSTDNLATVAGSNYIKNQIPNTTALNHGVWQWNVGDLVAVAASDGDQIFRFSGNDFTTLVNLPSSGGGGGTVTVTGGTPTVGDFAAFSGATSIADTGYFPSSNANAIVSTISTDVVNGNFAVYKDNNGSIGDNGYVPSNPGKTNVVMANGTTATSELAVFTDANGTIDVSYGFGFAQHSAGAIYTGNSEGTAGGFIAYASSPNTGGITLAAQSNAGSFFTEITNSSHAQDTAYSIPDCGTSTGNILNKNSSAFFVNHVLIAASTNGVVSDSGIPISLIQLNTNIKAAQSADIGGAGAGPLVVAATGLTSASVVVATVLSSSNPVSVIACVAAADQFSITFSADPGASCIINWMAFVAPQ